MLIDIHNHILPGIDDGPTTEMDAVFLLQNAVKNGITHIIATPHHQNGVFTQNAKEVKKSIQILNDLMEEKEIPVVILPGMEVHLHGEIMDELYTNIVTLADSGKYILIEFPTHQIPNFTESIFYELQLKGYIPVIAHAEKNYEFRRDPKILFDLINKGALIQLTAGSITGANGRRLQKFSLKLCHYKMVHFIASDSHDVKHRPFLLKQAYNIIRRKIGKQMVTYLQENAKHVLEGEEFQPFTPTIIKKLNF